MVNNSTHINNTNNNLSPQTMKTKKTTTNGVGYPVPGMGQKQTCDEVKQTKSNNWKYLGGSKSMDA